MSHSASGSADEGYQESTSLIQDALFCYIPPPLIPRILADIGAADTNTTNGRCLFSHPDNFSPVSYSTLLSVRPVQPRYPSTYGESSSVHGGGQQIYVQVNLEPTGDPTHVDGS